MEQELEDFLVRIEGKIDRLISKASASGRSAFQSSGPVQVDPTAKPRLIAQLNAYPTPGKLYKKYVGIIPDDCHIEYDDANDEEVLCKTCGPLGGN